MKQTFWVLSLIGGLLVTSQVATAAFVFNPTLTMPQTYGASDSRLIKVEMPAAKGQRAHHKACSDVKDGGTGAFAYPKVSMNQ
jgi:hypothetical protein